MNTPPRILTGDSRQALPSIRYMLKPGEKCWIVGRYLVASETRPIRGAVLWVNPIRNEPLEVA